MARVPADGDSATPEDSTSDKDSEPLLLPANGEAASGISARDEEATGTEVPKSTAAVPKAGFSRASAAGVPVTMGNWKLPGRGKIAPSNGSSSGMAPCVSIAVWEPAGSAS